MEIEGQDGSKMKLKDGAETVFGRGNGFHGKDLTVSRRQVSFQLSSQPRQNGSETGPRVFFEVIGRNPIWVSFKEDGNIRAFKRFERGELGTNDMFCVSSKDPVWLTLKTAEAEGRENKLEIDGREMGLSQSLEIASGFWGNGDLGLESIDVSSIDPIKEFGFLVIGHEFDKYPKRMIRDIKSWNWFLDDPRREESEEESNWNKGMKGLRRKRRKTQGNDDEDWTDEIGDDEQIANERNFRRPKYRTRSIDLGSKTQKNSRNRKDPARKESIRAREEEDEDDETLGGFIVDDDDVEEGEESEDDGEEEEEGLDDDDE
ncbi:hypothetical protein Nepgr_005605 [Nepenthes gracilis]|uniref:Uncharacterized protein n=1 Tax=Nepenthes gracilis TaxID=150966 RepID=A0AAD3XGR8_NEPGR|nr:hypothetical protein Nepgr_005605 [Nepenthes gracilis]